MGSVKLKTVVECLAQWFGLGRIKFAPGTFGTIGAIPLVYAFVWLGPKGYLIATFVFILFSIAVAHAYETMNQSHDPSEIVIDEVAGFLVSMAWLPLNWMSLLAAFVLFRFFDILKPYPISYLDKKVTGGFGTVIDDIAAGLIVNVLLQWWSGRFS
jgi:phosphatidylglycerophosphatase A